MATVPAVGVAGAAAAQAQTAPSSVPTREELDARSGRQQTAPRGRVTIEGDIERSPCALADPAYAGIKVTLSEVSFNNLGPVAAADLAPAYADLIGHEASITALCDVRDRAATILRRQGYLAAVQVPTQRIEGGKVRFEVLYAKLTAVRVRGDAGRSEGLFQAYLNHLTQGAVFNRIEAERYMLLARDVPGYDVRLVLKPAGTGPGEMIGEVTLRRTAAIVDATVQNYGSRETGRFAGQVRAEVYGLTGLGDRTSLSAYTTADFQEQQVVAASHDMLIGGEGFRIGARATYAWTRPDLGAAVPPVRARTFFANAEASYPVVRTLGAGLLAAGGFDFVNQNVRFNGLPLSRDRLRVVYARLDADAIDTHGVGPGGTTGWRLAGSLEVRRGLDIFNASPNCVASPARCAGTAVPPSLVDGDSTATVIRAQGVAEAHVTRKLIFSITPRGQYAHAALPSFEQFSLGNYTLGRGYDPGTLAADSGVGAAAELRATDIALFPKARIAAEPYVFVDAAWVWNRYVPSPPDPQRLVSIGGGVRLNYADRARIDMTLAVPVRDAGTIRSGDVRFLISLTTRLVPWSNR